MGKDTKKSSKPAKWVALATYAIALLCLLAGLLVPLAPVTLKEAFKLDNMLIMQAFAALGAFGLNIPFAPETFVYSYASNVKLFGAIPAFNIGAVLVLLYVLVCIIALVCLIPVIASNRYKATALKAASFAEILGAVVAGLFVLVQLGQFAVGTSEWNSWAYAPIIALGGCALMMFIQSVAYRKGSGIIKFILVLLSVVAVFSALFANVASDKLGGVVEKLPAFIKDYSLYNNGTAVFGVSLISALFTGEFSTIFAGEILNKVLSGVVLVLGLLVVINAILDLMGLGKTTKLYMLVANIVRYVLELVLVILFIVFTFVLRGKGVTLGFFGYVLAVAALLQFIINLIRLLIFTARKKKKSKKTKGAKTAVVAGTVTAGENAESTDEEKVDKIAEKRAAKEAKKAEKAAKKAAKQAEEEVEETDAETAAAETAPLVQKNTDPTVYKVEPTYDGPVDDFIKKLTNAERIEFAYCFIEKNVVLPNVPEYVVGGNNKKFFDSVFIYWARISSRVSDGLMNKLYEQGNIMN